MTAHIDEGLDGHATWCEGGIEDALSLYRARCSCGWVSISCARLKNAEKWARYHLKAQEPTLWVVI